MYGKIQIIGEIEVATGMHIGGGNAFSAIGAVDSTVIRDVTTNLPMIPGSSLKGKMRTLLAKKYNQSVADNPDQDAYCITRLFGSAKKDSVKKSRLIFSDMILSNGNELRKQGVTSLTEVKFENSINRVTAVANPRQIERVIRGSVFLFDLIYEMEEEKEILEDMTLLVEGMKLLQYDYLGGNGSRGYGKVRFHNLSMGVVIGTMNDDLLEQCEQQLKEV